MFGDCKIDAFARPVSDLADVPNMSAGKLKEHFDSNSNELKDALNALIDKLDSSEAASGIKDGNVSVAEKLEKLKSGLESEEKARLSSFEAKVDKEAGKGLSANDFTDEEKEKLGSLENYDDSEVRKLIENETVNRNLTADSLYSTMEVRAAELDNKKADKADTLFGYGIENAYSSTQIDDMVIPTISYADLDTVYKEGMYRVVKDAHDDISGGYTTKWNKEYYLLIVKYGEVFNEDGSRNEDNIYQMLIGVDGKVKTRFTYTTGYWYQDWSEYIPTPKITHQSYISSVSGTTTTYTFNTKGYSSPTAAYKISHTGTNTVTFEFGEPGYYNNDYTNEIIIYFKTELDNAIVWGLDVKFVNGEIPTIDADTYYKIYAEYNPIMKKWVIEVKNHGTEA